MTEWRRQEDEQEISRRLNAGWVPYEELRRRRLHVRVALVALVAMAAWLVMVLMRGE